LERVLAAHPGEPSAEGLYGQVLLDLRLPADALPHLERAARWRPEDPAVWFAIGTARLQLGRASDARQALETTVRLAPRPSGACLRRASACHLAGDGAARDAGLARAAALPEAADGKVEALRHELETRAPRTPP